MSALSGMGALVRLILRRDRVVMPVWVGLGAVIPLVIVASMNAAYPTAEARRAFAAAATANPTQMAMLGPVFDASVGGLTAWRVRGWAALFVGLAGLFTVTRHTRAEEETGRRELLGSAVVGRHAPLTAALVATAGAMLLLAALVAAGLCATGLPAAGALALGLSAAAAGWVMAAVGSVTAQLTASARAANGLGGVALGLAYFARGIGDVRGAPTLSRLSPFGWTEAMRPFAHEQWWPLVPVLALCAALVAGAYRLSSRRDLGAGLLPPRLGPAEASPRLRSPLALAWRLQRGALLAWTAGAFALGAALGGTGHTVAGQLAASAQMRALLARVGGARPVDGFFALILYLAGQVISVYAIQAALRLRTEETTARAEPVLATAVSRARWAASHLVVAAVGPAVVLAALGAGIGLTYGASTGAVGTEVPRMIAAAVVRLPAVWVAAAIAAALFGLWPRFAVPATWLVFLGLLMLDLLGERPDPNQWALNLSPYVHVPGLPATSFTLAPLLWLTVVAAALTAVGLAAFRRRDVG